ncbi:integrase-like protein [Amycolatopsis echigonensis]|uniref:Integrase-like protein n=1 Tax=Amycolatopsis echigonensis TaxID=2576905 RepID=A0A2N3WPU7_9PSEU|nr:site-specific integrase [Amycolatopsis niigatensis]PKV95897.1 integrase-like protein [Amycolatopsis niigatensis]
MGYTKDLWTRPETQPDGKVTRVPNKRWGTGKRWLACWLDPDEQPKTKAFTNKTPATKYWQKMEADRDRGEYVDPKAGRELFDSIAKRWFSVRKVDPSTMMHDQGVYRRHVEPVLAKRPVKAIKPSEIQAFQTKLGETHGPSTVAAARRIIVGVLDLAGPDGDELIKKNPAKAPIVKKVQSGDGGSGEPVVAWADETVFALIDAHPEYLRMLPTMAAGCGHREAEAFAVAEDDIDEERGVLYVRRQIKKLGKDYVFALPKNDRTREVPMPPSIAAGLRAHIDRFPPEPLTLPWEKPGGELRTHRVLFRWRDGGHLKARAYSETAWKPALVAAKVIPNPAKDNRGRRKYVTTGRQGTHQLRHYYASVMLADGVSIRELAEYLGHANPAFTLRVYSHLLPDSHDRARQAIDRRLFRPRAVG